MAYLIKNLGKINKGEKIEIGWTHKEYHLELIKKNCINYSTSRSFKTAFLSIKVTDYKTTITIPENGFWQLLVRTENIEHEYSKLYYKTLVSEQV